MSYRPNILRQPGYTCFRLNLTTLCSYLSTQKKICRYKWLASSVNIVKSYNKMYAPIFKYMYVLQTAAAENVHFMKIIDKHVFKRTQHQLDQKHALHLNSNQNINYVQRLKNKVCVISSINILSAQHQHLKRYKYSKFSLI